MGGDLRHCAVLAASLCVAEILALGFCPGHLAFLEGAQLALGLIPPKVAAIHSMAGFGRCSMTVIIPVLSTMGIQVCPLPTAILSTHSGGFGDMAFTDLTAGMDAYATHWHEIGLTFDAIYSGFLGSARQIEIVGRFIEGFRRGPDQLIVVDPVMADGGKLYRTYTPEMRHMMGQLAARATIITPNLTEAYFLLNEPYRDRPMAAPEIRSMLSRLADLGPETVVVKSVRTEDGRHANVAFSRRGNEFCQVPFERIPVNYPGTGDVFASVLVGALLNGNRLADGIAKATAFLSEAVRITRQAGTPEREGVLIEKVLPSLGSASTALEG